MLVLPKSGRELILKLKLVGFVSLVLFFGGKKSSFNVATCPSYSEGPLNISQGRLNIILTSAQKTTDDHFEYTTPQAVQIIPPIPQA